MLPDHLNRTDLLMFSLAAADQPEPTAADLATIDVEMPLIEAELDQLDAEITLIYAEDRGGPSALDWRRLRRAEARVTRLARLAAEVTTHQCGYLDWVESRMSQCRYGCKIFTCRVCGRETVMHSPTYGCRTGRAS